MPPLKHTTPQGLGSAIFQEGDTTRLVFTRPIYAMPVVRFRTLPTYALLIAFEYQIYLLFRLVII